MTARFLLVTGVVRDGFSHPAWPDVASPLRGTPAADGTWLSWRLTGANHRELGRSVLVFPSVAAVLTEITDLQRSVQRLVRLVAASPRDARWTWRVERDGATAAASSRAYSRNRECLYNLETFMAALPMAEVSDVVPVNRFTSPPRQPEDVLIPAPTRAADAPVNTSGYAG